VLFSLVVINWAVVSHNHYQVVFLTDEGVKQGFNDSGRSLLYAVMLTTLALPAGGGLGRSVRGARQHSLPGS
jgi:hypothetical protein